MTGIPMDIHTENKSPTCMHASLDQKLAINITNSEHNVHLHILTRKCNTDLNIQHIQSQLTTPNQFLAQRDELAGHA